MICEVNENIVYIVCQGFDVRMIIEKLVMPFLFYVLTRKSFYFSPPFAAETCACHIGNAVVVVVVFGHFYFILGFISPILKS